MTQVGDMCKFGLSRTPSAYEGRGGVEGECSASLMNGYKGGYVMSHPISLLIKGIYLNLLHSRRVSGFSALASHSASVK